LGLTNKENGVRSIVAGYQRIRKTGSRATGEQGIRGRGSGVREQGSGVGEQGAGSGSRGQGSVVRGQGISGFAIDDLRFTIDIFVLRGAEDSIEIPISKSEIRNKFE